jgi:CheY-like chemotaxis protein/signal transduction histidine kinase
VPPSSFDSGDIKLLMSSHIRGNRTPIADISLTNYETGSRKAFWRTFFNQDLVTAVTFSSFVISLISILFWFYMGRKENFYIYFSLTTLFVGIAYINIIINYPSAQELTLWKISRVSFVLAPIFLLLFTLSTLHFKKLARKLIKPLLAIALLLILYILIQNSKFEVENAFGVAINTIVTPSLIGMIIASIYSIFKSPQKSSILIFIGILSIFATSLYDLYYFKSQIIPYCWTVVYGYLLVEVAIVSLLSRDVGRLIKSNFLSEKQLEMQNYELQFQQNKLKRVSESKTRFIKNMSHEFKTPLQGIITTSELLQNNENNGAIDKVIEALNIQMQKHFYSIQNVLDLSILEEGTPDLVKRTFKSKKLLNHIKTMFLNSEVNRDNSVNIECNHSVPELLSGEDEHIGRSVVNVITNICNHTNNSSVQISVDWDNTKESLIFSISNEDKKVNPKIIETIEEGVVSFQHFEESETIDELAIPVAMRLISINGGEIFVNGDNSEVIIGFPLSVVKERRRKDNPRRVQGKILVVEDNPINRMLITKLLTKLGYEVLSAENGKEAVNITQTEHPSMIIMDIQMPVMDGIEATKKIRNSEFKEREIAIVGLTANASKEECLNAGMNDFLPKPAGADDLKRVISRYIGS